MQFSQVSQRLKSHNIGFPKADGLSIQKLHSKSIYLSMLLNFPDPVPEQPTIMIYFIDAMTNTLVPQLV